MKIAFISFILLIAGCATPHTNRLETLNQKIDAAGVLLKAAKDQGDTAAAASIEKDLDALRGEREKVSELAREEMANRHTLLLAILAVVTGGLKMAADKFGKAVL